jgi:hypothetical protein
MFIDLSRTSKLIGYPLTKPPVFPANTLPVCCCLLRAHGTSVDRVPLLICALVHTPSTLQTQRFLTAVRRHNPSDDKLLTALTTELYRQYWCLGGDVASLPVLQDAASKVCVAGLGRSSQSACAGHVAHLQLTCVTCADRCHTRMPSRG